MGNGAAYAVCRARPRGPEILMRRLAVIILGLLAVAGASVPASAQMYALARSVPPNGAANVYFGSAKDSDGKHLTGVVVNLNVGPTTYVAVTDDTGRYRLELPEDVLPTQVQVACSKPGYVLRAAT